MKILTVLPLVAVLAAASPLTAHAQDGIDPTKAKAFDTRMFAGPIGDKASACFMRRYDAAHLKQHPKQKVSAMKLLVTAENRSGEPTSYAYRVGVRFRNRPGNFDGGNSCGHFVDEDGNKEIRYSCEADCGGGGLEIALSKDNKSSIVRLAEIAIWDRKHPEGEVEALDGGADDKVFRLDRVDNRECDELLTKHEEQAALRQ
ncbi:MAG TPA: hypothetical protein VKR55_04155 [Bradyrhizobium sp.]|uniref:hypothetical protein n=1 Tax=Bradyrhizobium sp. TaxID=376 RepID=UPI002C78B2C0|nr:hypothetical protein [Bradyrhizobium sp.]HLZ01328.1 hypothetical protein [Bradyrhizobium sp.]